MAPQEKGYIVLRKRTRAERREEIVIRVFGGVFSLALWAAISLHVGRLLAQSD